MHPHRCARHARESLVSRHKGGGSGAAIEEQKKARLQSAAQFQEQMALMRQQYEDSKKVKPVSFAPASPSAAGSPETYLAGLEARRRSARRFGSAATNLTAPVMGGATPMAA